jgi:long-chain fatty acid transport protein
MAGAGAALAAGYDAVYENPAGLARISERRLTLGYYYGHFLLDINPNISRHPDDANATVLGGEVPIPFTGALKNRVGLGFGFYLPVGLITRANVPRSDEQSFILLENRAQVVGFQVATGVRLSDRWDVGAGVLALAALTGDIQIDSDSSGRISTRSEQQLVADYAPIVGVTLHLEVGDLALVYRGESQAGYDVTIENNLADQLPVGLPKLRLHGVAQYDPRMTTFEVAWHTLPHTRVVTGVTWKRWSEYPGLANAPSMKSTPPAMPDFTDTVVGRIAIERGLTESVQVRAGYAFEPTPLQNQKGSIVFDLDNDRHIFGLGMGIVHGPWNVDFFAQAQLLNRDAHSSGEIYVGGVAVGVNVQ